MRINYIRELTTKRADSKPVLQKLNRKNAQNGSITLSNYATLKGLSMQRNNVLTIPWLQPKLVDGCFYIEEESKTGVVPSSVQQVIHSSGKPLDPVTRALMEFRLDHDFSRVRVHTDKQAAKSAWEIGARAYTVGQDIVMGEGEYTPGTSKGQQLLTHEAAHVAHQAHASSIRPGFAPFNSIAERKAEELAAFSLKQPKRTLGPLLFKGFQDWGPVWQIHLTPRILRQGEVLLEQNISNREHGRPIGRIEVRRGEVVQVPPHGLNIPLGMNIEEYVRRDTMAFEFSGRRRRHTRRGKWLQFAWIEIAAQTNNGTVSRLRGELPHIQQAQLTTNPAEPQWFIDTHSSSDPYYESRNLNIRTEQSTTIFDLPIAGTSTAGNIAQHIFDNEGAALRVTFTANFRTYLVYRNRAIYCVVWITSMTFRREGDRAIADAPTHQVIEQDAISGLPENLVRILHTQFSEYRRVR